MSNFLKDLKHIRNDNKMNNGVNVSLYDYVASNYYKLSKEELKELILNLDYIMYDLLDKEKYLDLETRAIEETIDRLGE